MASKIEQLRVQFRKMGAPQKKQFIERLRSQLANSKNSQYRAFLNECIREYSSDVKKGSSSSSKAMQAQTEDTSDSPKGNEKISTGKTVAIIMAILLPVVLITGVFFFVFFDGFPERGLGAQGTAQESATTDTVTPITSGNGNNNSGGNATLQQFAYGRNFSDGVAWVSETTPGPFGIIGGQWHLIDKTGRIILSLDDGESPTTNFSHGVAIVLRSDMRAELIDKTGYVISSPNSGEYDAIHGFIPDIGMILVSKRVETFELTENQAGIIDSRGNWQVELTNSPVLVNRTIHELAGFPGEIGVGSFELSIPLSQGMRRSFHAIYGGEGVFALQATGGNVSQTSFFNVLDNTGEITISHCGLSDWAFRSGLRFDNGFAVVASGTAILAVDRFADETDINILSDVITHWQNVAHVGEYSNGLFYFSNFFFDRQGNKVIDLSNYAVQSWGYFFGRNQLPKFVDGYALIPLINPQGAPFFTIIDMNGNFMFEPVVRPIHNWLPILSYGLVVLQDGGRIFGGSGGYIVINTSGEIVVDLGNVDRVSHFRDGVAMVIDDGQVYYIDALGRRLF